LDFCNIEIQNKAEAIVKDVASPYMFTSKNIINKIEKGVDDMYI
jgi:hypothetical protein